MNSSRRLKLVSLFVSAQMIGFGATTHASICLLETVQLDEQQFLLDGADCLSHSTETDDSGSAPAESPSDSAEPPPSEVHNFFSPRKSNTNSGTSTASISSPGSLSCALPGVVVIDNEEIMISLIGELECVLPNTFISRLFRPPRA